MSTAIAVRKRVLLLNDEPGLAHRVAQDPTVEVIGQVPDPETCLQMVAEIKPDILILNIGLIGNGLLEATMERARSARQGLEIVCLYQQRTAKEPERLKQPTLFPSLGIQSVAATQSVSGLPPQTSTAAQSSVQDLRALAAGSLATVSVGSKTQAPGDILLPALVAVFSPKGGTGKTVVAVNLACFLARHLPHKVALVDLDLAFGDAAVHLDLLSQPTIADTIHGLETDRPGLDEFLHIHAPTTLRFLSSPAKPELAEFIRPEHARRALARLRGQFPVIVVDLPSEAAADHVLDTLEAATHVVLVCTPDATSVRRCRLFLDVLARLESIDRSKVILVVNRQDHSVGLATSRVASFLGTEVSMDIPEARAKVEESILEGRPLGALGQESPFISGIRQLAQLLSPAFTFQPPSRTVKLPFTRRGGFGQ